ncbi:phospholipase A2 inhibitor gamma subunit B-like [Engraulis encrasicolus]|uniref:phospholipase A2 inhibitor gamma subunit B-like n=1 Tax=Engraulis encrasicolus TaxID=184585 RepID=UPI002FD74978
MTIKMRSIFTITLIWGLFCRGHALICNQCIPVTYPWQCTNTESACGTGSCGSMTVTTYNSWIRVLSMNFKTCLPPEQCITGTLNFGFGTTATVSTACCKTDLCNSQDTPELNTNTTLNGRKCFTCHLGHDCKQSISCQGNEDRCMKTAIDVYGEMITAKGCASSSLCRANLSAQLGSMSENLNCCEGDLCNGAKHVGGGVLLLLGSVVSVLVFH